MDRVTRLIEAIRKLTEAGFTGYVKINFTQGSLGRIEKSEELDGTAIIATAEKRKKEMEEGKSFSHDYK